MAIIEAKYNDTPYVWNPLDPNCWEGGVVPGRNDTARFRRGGTVYAAYEYDYKVAPNYLIGPSGQDSKTILPSDFKPTYRHPIWTRIASELPGLHNGRIGTELGTSRQYGGKTGEPNSDYNMPGIWTSGWSYNTAAYTIEHQHSYVSLSYNTPTPATKREAAHQRALVWVGVGLLLACPGPGLRAG